MNEEKELEETITTTLMSQIDDLLNATFKDLDFGENITVPNLRPPKDGTKITININEAIETCKQMIEEENAHVEVTEYLIEMIEKLKNKMLTIKSYSEDAYRKLIQAYEIKNNIARKYSENITDEEVREQLKELEEENNELEKFIKSEIVKKAMNSLKNDMYEEIKNIDNMVFKRRKIKKQPIKQPESITEEEIPKPPKEKKEKETELDAELKRLTEEMKI